MGKFVSWVEIPTQDFDRAVTFYEKVFQQKLNKEDFGNEKMACFESGEGAVVAAPGFSPANQGVFVSFEAPDNLEKTMNRLVENGGKIIQGKTKIEVENRAFFAICLDCEGNKIGLYGN